ncbi:hypothetical protein LX32DRAFT_241371 [Colletotrichum zoysiae]|uniref:Uncharacterized protein n=1 Tax=Colletotrichum zoysiae TaxID=1216348 RepID=A0AAD9H4E2_9PEZI|nr:hypothetical protein LX32DRAFT_241371 [Colletotrichum zoysiae]
MSVGYQGHPIHEDGGGGVCLIRGHHTTLVTASFLLTGVLACLAPGLLALVLLARSLCRLSSSSSSAVLACLPCLLSCLLARLTPPVSFLHFRNFADPWACIFPVEGPGSSCPQERKMKMVVIGDGRGQDRTGQGPPLGEKFDRAKCRSQTNHPSRLATRDLLRHCIHASYCTSYILHTSVHA